MPLILVCEFVQMNKSSQFLGSLIFKHFNIFVIILNELLELMIQWGFTYLNIMFLYLNPYFEKYFFENSTIIFKTFVHHLFFLFPKNQ